MRSELLIYDIIEAIVSNISQEDLLSTALICRAFYESAMDRRWSELRTLEPLVSCLPEEVLGDDETSGRPIVRVTVPCRRRYVHPANDRKQSREYRHWSNGNVSGTMHIGFEC